MKLVEDQKGFETMHAIINGDGDFPDKLILEKICEKYNGSDKVILYARTGLKRKAGLSALDSIKVLIDHGFCNFIFIADSEHIQEDSRSEIKRKLNEIGINWEEEIILLEEAFWMKCRCAHHNIFLYSIISGSVTCIEEDVVRFLELKLNRKISIPEDKNPIDLKRIIREIADKKELKRLLKESGKRMLENAFPNICAVVKKVENDFE